MHESNYVDLWFEIRDAWLELCRFMIRSRGRMNRITLIYDSNGRIMTRQTGSLFRNTRFMNRKPGSLFWNTRYMIRLTGSLTSSGSVYLTTRNDTPQTTFCRVIFLPPRPGAAQAISVCEQLWKAGLELESKELNYRMTWTWKSTLLKKRQTMTVNKAHDPIRAKINKKDSNRAQSWFF